jgi:hypothetical protein
LAWKDWEKWKTQLLQQLIKIKGMFKSQHLMRLMGLSMALLVFVNTKAQQPVSLWLV